MYPNGGHFPPAGQMPQSQMPLYPMAGGGVPNMVPMQMNPMAMQQAQMMQQVPQNMYVPNMMPANNQMYMVPPQPPQMYARPPVDPMAMRGPPPTYSTVTSKDYKAQQDKLLQQQQKQMEGQRKLLEQQMKQRQFQEQQQRLRQFSTMGGRKMDADSLIDSIVGRPKVRPVMAVNKHATVPAMQPAPQPQMRTSDDDFGGFMTGPSTAPTTPTAAPPPAPHPPAPHPPAPHPPLPQNMPPQAPLPVEKPGEPKKDLFNMMLQCSDLTAPKEAKGFARKPCVKDVQVQKRRQETYSESQKSRRWEADTNALSELFTLPGQGSQAFILPKWMTGDVAVPDVYNQVLEAVTMEGAIDTNLLYPILLRSGLSREVLGQIWQMCNKTTPGQLIREELFCILALVSIAQNNMNYSSLEVLVKCPQAPIPNLGQDEMSIGQKEATPPAVQIQSPAQPPAVTACAGTIAPPIPGPVLAPLSVNVPPEDDFADFADFQSAPPSTPGLLPQTPLSVSIPPPSMDDVIGQEDKYSAFKSVLTDVPTDDDFGDFKSTDSRDDSLSLASMEAALKSPPSQTDDSPTKGMSDSVSFSSFTSDSSNRIITPPTNLNTLDFADFKMASSETNTKPDDKYSALKALIMDKNLFEAPKEKETTEPEWADFKVGEEAPENTQEEDEWASFSTAPSNSEISSQPPSTFNKEIAEPAPKPAIKVDNSKANKLFGVNLAPKKTPVGTGLSALDMLPPDFTEDEEEEPSGIDKFGTFQGGMIYGDEGISSIRTPYGALDDLDLVPESKPSYVKLQYLSESKPSKDNSPTDSQSVSSLDFAANTPGDHKNFIGQLDVQSVASLDLKTVSSEVDLQLEAETAEDVANGNKTDKEENAEDFGDFSSASIENKEPAKPVDAKEMLTETTRLGDRYGSLMNEPQDSERHIYMWQQCLQQCAQMISQACVAVSSIHNPSVMQEVISSDKGSEYLTAVAEIYKVSCRIKQAMVCHSASDQKLSDLMLDIESSWGTLTVFIASTHVMPAASALSFHKATLKPDNDNTQVKACGVCLLNVDYVSNGSHDNGNQKLIYGGKQYHAQCANFWVNCVDSTLPALKIPVLL